MCPLFDSILINHHGEAFMVERELSQSGDPHNQNLSGAAMPKAFRVLFHSGDGMQSCGKDGKCPTVYELADGQIGIQGFKSEEGLKSAIGVPTSEDLVVIPREFFEKILKGNASNS